MYSLEFLRSNSTNLSSLGLQVQAMWTKIFRQYSSHHSTQADQDYRIFKNHYSYWSSANHSLNYPWTYQIDYRSNCYYYWSPSNWTHFPKINQLNRHRFPKYLFLYMRPWIRQAWLTYLAYELPNYCRLSILVYFFISM